MGFSRISALTITAMLFSAGVARADALIDGAKSCTQYFPTNEVSYQIPVHLLAAIASAESGRWHQGLDMPLPWPWTINAAGKSYYLDSKAEAIATAQQLMAKGVTSMDVGCMQVNLKHHAGAFRDLNEAFDPQANVTYAAKFLRTNYDSLGDWVRATAAYHSRTPTLGSKYLKRIEVTWNRIVERVRMAQSKLGTAAVAVPAPEDNPLSASVTAPGLPGSRGVRVLQVSGGDSDGFGVAAPSNQRTVRDSVLVVSPRALPTSAAGAPVKVTMVKQDLRDDLLVKGNLQADATAAVISDTHRLDKPAAAAQNKPASTFVFAN